ncbi:alpha/beta hydrolase [Leucothrix pacifica]|uniref:Alpha/beta hydrolase n=1 Tax=Leucothrix pacifica TaxID=1247513 RepID=A0A317CHA9_9GAMM|nr:alpha/beta hydrolase [Leucothrix pacifica]PWQ97749.1 hypothetical protein DKW60_10300 [Leucothrix pacifica]
MKAYHLYIDNNPQSETVGVTLYGAVANKPLGSTDCQRSNDPVARFSPDLVIDLQPLLEDIEANKISSAEELAASDDLLQLRDLLLEEDYVEFCKMLFAVLTHAIQQGTVSKGISRSGPAQHPSRWSDPDKRLVRVWFATNRLPTNIESIDQDFSSDLSAEALTYGVCNVFIPKSHKPGSTGTAWWRRWIRLEEDDTLKVHNAHAIPKDDFWAGFQHKLTHWWKPGERNAFALIHGFNVSFEEAAVRAAQIGYDLKLPGEIAFYSWPSRGNVSDYPADEATISASVKYIAQFLQELCENSGAERVHVFVHSMGNRGFIAALERLMAKGYPELKLGQVFFCAPDEDVRTFRDKTAEFPHQYENRTLYVSGNDRAVAASRWLHKADRVGVVPPVYQYSDIETIEVDGFGILELGHGYFASAEPLIEDMREAIESSKTASQRSTPVATGNHYLIDVANP